MKDEIHRFLHHLRVEKGSSKTTIEAYQFELEKGLMPFLNQRRKFEAGGVTKDDIRAYLDYMAETKGNSNVTRARKLAVIKSFFNYLVDNEGMEVNPAVSISSPRIPEKEPVYLTDEECCRLLMTITQQAKIKVRERDLGMIVLFLHSGLRVSELAQLELANVELRSGQIKVTRKGNKEQYLPLNCETVNVLAKYLANRPKLGNGRFFVGTNGGNLDRIYIYGLVRKYLNKAGINKSKQGPHLLRHTFCTRLYQKGVGPFVIKDLAGHKSLNTTMKYINIENKEQAEAIDRLEFGVL